MCGIGGKVSFTGSIDAGLADAMNRCMTHRGPDANGIYANDPAVLAHQRLSIIDLSEAGRQPMANADESVWIVFNGEIYNYRELREKVDHYRFRSETDTEVLLHLYEEYGTDCLDQLRGMFAFGIWDERSEQLFLARDRLGQKPLFYRHDEETLWFGSTIKTILADDTVPVAPDIGAIREYLTYQYVPHPATGFEGIKQLGPAEYVVFDADGTHHETYWDLSYADQSSASPDRLASQLRSTLRESVRLRMRSDVPVGVFLSGGIDSSVVTSLMDEVSDGPVRTYSMGFDKESYDELEYARQIVDRYDTDHTEYSVSPESIDLLPELIEQYEMPFGDSSALPTYAISEAAAADTTVVLNGTGGDETFAGYNRYPRDWVAAQGRRVPRTGRHVLTGLLSALPAGIREQTPLRQGHRIMEIADEYDESEQYARYIAYFYEDDAELVWDGPQPADEVAFLRHLFDTADGPTRLDRVLDVDTRSYLPGALLTKVDRASMAHGLEVRSPFLDHEVMEFAAQVPAKYKIRPSSKKWLLKQAFADDLPETILNRSKDGFGSPVNEWFRGGLREYTRDRLERLGQRELFDAAGLQTMLDRHIDGTEAHGIRLWDLIMLEGWYERFID